MKNKSIFVACDTSNLNEIKKIINHTNSIKLKIIPKYIANWQNYHCVQKEV